MALADLSSRAHLVQMLDSTIVRAHVSRAGTKGSKMVKHSAAPVVISRPGFTSRVTSRGGPLAFLLTGGEAGDSLSSRPCSTSGQRLHRV